MRIILLFIVMIFITGCSTHQLSLSDLPEQPSSDTSILYFIPNNSGAEIYQIKDNNEIFLGKTGVSAGDFTFKFIVANVKPGIYKFKAKKFSSESNVTVGKGQTIILTEEAVWDVPSVLGMFGVPALVAISQKQRIIAMEENEGIEKVLRFNRVSGAKIEIPTVLAP